MRAPTSHAGPGQGGGAAQGRPGLGWCVRKDGWMIRTAKNDRVTSSSSVFWRSGRISAIAALVGRCTLEGERIRWASRPLNVNIGQELSVRSACGEVS